MNWHLTVVLKDNSEASKQSTVRGPGDGLPINVQIEILILHNVEISTRALISDWLGKQGKPFIGLLFLEMISVQGSINSNSNYFI